MRRIDYGDGTVVYDEFNIDFSKPYNEQIDNLQEDLIQVKYDGDLLLDVGWYPEFNTDGHFMVMLVKHANWDAPLYCERSREERPFFESVEKAVKIANSMSKDK